MKKILYLGRFGLPESAAGIRVYRIAKLLSACDCQVQFGCYGANYQNRTETYDGFVYHFHTVFSGWRKVLNVADLYSDQLKYSFANKLIESYRPDMVILYNPTSRIAEKVRRFCQKRGIRVVVDVTEWYEIDHHEKGEKTVAKSVDNRIRRIDKKMDGIISISSYLTHYYTELGQRTYEIPPVMMEISRGDTSTKCSKDGTRLSIVYAGSPGRKDQLKNVVQAVTEINRQSVQVHLDIIGVKEEKALPGIRFYGRLPHNKTIDIVKQADFSVLFRENLRYAKAGFSTKFSESMSLGVPVICNEVGGCDTLIHNWENGIVLKDGAVETIKECLCNLLEQSDSTLEEMKKGAVKLAEERFSVRANKQTIQRMLDDLLGGNI